MKNTRTRSSRLFLESSRPQPDPGRPTYVGSRNPATGLVVTLHGGCEIKHLGEINMRSLTDDPSVRRTFDLGWKALFLGVVTILLSLIVSFAIVRLVEFLLS